VFLAPTGLSLILNFGGGAAVSEVWSLKSHGIFEILLRTAVLGREMQINVISSAFICVQERFKL
jgi:hypothetical protein